MKIRYIGPKDVSVWGITPSNHLPSGWIDVSDAQHASGTYTCKTAGSCALVGGGCTQCGPEVRESIFLKLTGHYTMGGYNYPDTLFTTRPMSQVEWLKQLPNR